MPQAQVYAALLGRDVDDFNLDAVAGVQHVFNAVYPPAGNLGDMEQPLDVVLELHYGAVGRNANDVAFHVLAHGVLLLDLGPGVALKLFDAQRYPAIDRIYGQDDGFDFLPFLEDLGGVAHPFSPGQIRDVDKAVDALFQLDEHAEFRNILYDALDAAAGRVPLLDGIPGVGHRLAEPQRDAFVLLVYLEDYDPDLVAYGQDFGRVFYALRPGHLGNVYQPLDAGLELDESAVIHDGDHFADNAVALVISLGHRLPGIVLQLLEAQRNAARLRVEVGYQNLQRLAYFHDLGRVVDAAPGEVRDVQQAVQAVQVDEGAEVGNVLNLALQNRSYLYGFQEALSLLFPFFQQQRLAGKDDIPPALVDFNNFHAEALADVRLEVAHRPQVQLGGRKERLDADVDDETAADAVDYPTLDVAARFVNVAHLVPGAVEVGLLLREDDDAVLILLLLQVNIYPVSY